MTDPARAAEDHTYVGHDGPGCRDCGLQPAHPVHQWFRAAPDGEQSTGRAREPERTCRAVRLWGALKILVDRTVALGWPEDDPYVVDSRVALEGGPGRCTPGSSAPPVEEALEAVERGLRDIKNALARALNTPEDAPATTLLVLADAVNCAVPDIGTALPVLRAAVEGQDRLRTEAAPAAHDLNALHHRINELHEQIDATRTGIIDPLRASLREAEAARDRYKTERDAIPNEANVGALLDLYHERMQAARARAAELEANAAEWHKVAARRKKERDTARAQVAELEAARDVSPQVKSDLSSLLNQAEARRERAESRVVVLREALEVIAMDGEPIGEKRCRTVARAALGEGGEG